jgi:ribosomal protein S6
MAIEYEVFYLVGERKETELPRIRTDIQKLVEGMGGSFLEQETTDRRRLAYPIKKETRGTYVARRFTLPDIDERGEEATGNPIEEISRKLKLSVDVLRFLIVRAEDLPELKQIERIVKEKTLEKKLGRGERERSIRPIAAAPVTTETPAAKEVSTKQIDEQLKDVLDI